MIKIINQDIFDGVVFDTTIEIKKCLTIEGSKLKEFSIKLNKLFEEYGI